MADTVFGIRFKDFVVLSAAGLGAHYYIKITDSEEKMVQIDDHKLVACAGENAARVNFMEYIAANLRLNKLRQYGRPSTTPAAAAFMRGQLAGALRSRGGAYAVNTLVAGYDAPLLEHDPTPAAAHLFYIDYLGTLQAVPYSAHGYGTTFVVAILDRYFDAEMNEAQAKELVQQCIDEVKKRVIISNAHFKTRVVRATGVETWDDIH